jgi:hypothetical protein
MSRKDKKEWKYAKLTNLKVCVDASCATVNIAISVVTGALLFCRHSLYFKWYYFIVSSILGKFVL